MKLIRHSKPLVLCVLLLIVCLSSGCAHKITIDQNIRMPEASKIENVPFVAQMPYFCGPASAEMILRYHGVNKFNQVQISSCDSENKKGAHWQKLISYLNWNAKKEGIAANSVYGNLDLLKKYVASGYPVLVRQWSNKHKTSRHYRVVVGYDDNIKKIIYHDPKHRADMKMDYQVFKDLWNIQVRSLDWSSKNLMIIIGKVEL